MLKFFLLFLFVFFIQVSQVFAEITNDFGSTGVLTSRKVIGSLNFKKNNFELSQSQIAEIDRIVKKSVIRLKPSQIIRVEGFSSDYTASPVDTAFSRAKAVWLHLIKLDAVASDKLYLTGFTDKQFDRVEIAIYDNPFDEKIDNSSKGE